MSAWGHDPRSVTRDAPILDEDLRGPDSAECSPFTHWTHDMCLLDYRSLGPNIGFVCGCQCHDPEAGSDSTEPAHVHRCNLGHPHPIVRCRCLDCGEWFDQPTDQASQPGT